MMVVAVAVAATVAGSMEGIGRACGWGGGVRNAKSRVAKLLCIDKTNEHIRTRVRESLSRTYTLTRPLSPHTSYLTPHTAHTTQQKRVKSNGGWVGGLHVIDVLIHGLVDSLSGLARDQLVADRAGRHDPVPRVALAALVAGIPTVALTARGRAVRCHPN